MRWATLCTDGAASVPGELDFVETILERTSSSMVATEVISKSRDDLAVPNC